MLKLIWEKVMKVENVKVEKLDNLGRGIARIDNKIVFIENALPEEVVDIEIIKDKNKKSAERKEICRQEGRKGGGQKVQVCEEKT